ncbi:MAG: DUF4331 domain-containing protein [Catenulisporales bacterium]|nr:DUF4331 domain-containing protein [Catenulisporales bacterium]
MAGSLRGLIRHRRFDRSLCGVGAALLAASGTVGFLAPGVSSASSHREAPLISGDPKADNTDVYAFVSPDKPDTVTLVSNWIPFEEPNGGPNFYPFANDAQYNIKIDNVGDGKPHIVYTWKFTDHVRDSANQFLYNTGVVKNLTDPTLNFLQTYTLTETDNGGTPKVLVDNAVAAPSDVGPASMPDYAALRQQAITRLAGGGQTLAGQAADPFFLDLRVFDLLYGGNLKETGHNTLAGYNVNTIALQVPKSALALKGDATRNPVVGIWSTTDRQGASVTGSAGGGKDGSVTQVSRLGNPLVNEVVVPLKLKDAFNGLPPDLDHTVKPVVDKVLDPMVPHLIQSVFGIPAPPTPRNDLAEIFLTGVCKSCGPIKADLNSQKLNMDASASSFTPAEELRLNMAVPPTAVPSRLGVLAGDAQGFPNGRRLADDVVDIEIQALEGAALTGKIVPALAAGDRVNLPQRPFGKVFPYVALPNDGAVNDAAHHGANTGTPEGGVATGLGGLAFRSSVYTPVAACVGGVLLTVGGFLMARRRRTGA